MIVPESAEEVAAALRELGARAQSARIVGAGTELPSAELPLRADATLSTRALSGILELDAGEGVAHVAAGTPVATLHAAARANGLEVPIHAPSVASTVGGALAAAALGPRAHGFGRARDAVLGLDVVLGSGERTRCGGRVVKNVTGYDLAKLYVGSHGTLAVLTHAWLRLRPAPETVEAVAAPLAEREAFRIALEASRVPGVRAAALVDRARAFELGSDLPPGAAFLLVLELASDTTVVAAARAALADRHGTVSVRADAIDAVAALEGAATDAARTGELRVRVTARASRLEAAHAVLRNGGFDVVTHPGLGLLSARLAPGRGEALTAARVDAALAAARSAARAGEGQAILAAAPETARIGRPVMLDAPPSFALQQRIAHQFDPRGVLNPGRLFGAPA